MGEVGTGKGRERTAHHERGKRETSSYEDRKQKKKESIQNLLLLRADYRPIWVTKSKT